ncbi:MAG: hypothetical protein HZB62_00175 [Nitrospirae bacterium]|nr:hypothetical protein [Nitrospirota bacterium]
MLVGYNTNISYKGIVYHVQTEDSGLKNPHIITLLYNKGTILSRKKVSYAEIASSPDYKETVQEMMKEQHKAMIKELIAGKHTQDVAASQPAPGPTAEATALHPHPSVPAAPVQTSPAPPAEEKPVEPAQTRSAAPEKEKPSEPEIDKKQITKSLDDILLDYIMKEEDN